MKGSLIALGDIGGRKAAAFLRDGALDDLVIDGDDPARRPGAIHRAIVERPLKGQGGALVRLAGGETGFARAAKGLVPGRPVLVQVTGHAEPGKALPVTTRLLFKGRYAIVTPDAPGINVSRRIRDEEQRVELLELAHADSADGEGLIIRSAAAEADPAAVSEEISALRETCRALLADAEGAPEFLLEGPDAHLFAWQEWPEAEVLDRAEGAFSRHGLTEMIHANMRPELPLPSGYLAFIEPTRALVAVDVNTGADGSHASGLKANIALARALPRALRVRGLGGQVVIDLAPMARKDRKQFEQILRAGFRACPVDTALVGWTGLGHYELQRKRARLPLTEVLAGGAHE